MMKFIDDGANIEVKPKHRLDTFGTGTLAALSMKDTNFRFTEEDFKLGPETMKKL